MADGFKVAQGYVEVDADYAKLDAAIADIIARLKAIKDVVVDASVDQGALDRAIAEIQAKLDTLKMKALSAEGIDQGALDASLADIQAKMDAIRGIAIDAGVNQGDLDHALAQIKSKIQAVRTMSIDTDVDQGRLDLAVTQINAKLGAVRDLVVKASVDESLLNTELTAITERLAHIREFMVDPEVDQTVVSAQLAKLQAELRSFAGTAHVNMDISGLGATAAGLAKINTEMAATNASVSIFSNLIEKGTGLLGAWNPKIQLFGGLLRAIGLPHFIATVGAIHLVLDAVLEVAAVVIPATIALAAFGAAASGTIRDIARSEQAMYTITQALNVSMPGLNKGLQGFTNSVKPQVYVLFGEALAVINQHTGLFQQLATGAGHVLDNLGARAELALGGNGMGGLISHGVADLQILGNFIGNVFGIFGNVLKQLPGYAELLFQGLQNVTGALETITGVPIIQGILGIGLAFHGALIWGGLLGTAVALLAGPLTKLGSWFTSIGLSVASYVEEIIVADGVTASFEAAVAPLAAINPFVWVAAAVAALAALVIWMSTTKTATQQMFDATMQQVNAATTFTAANAALVLGLQQTNQQLQYTPKYIEKTTLGLHDQLTTVTALNPQWSGLTSNQQGFSAAQVTLHSRMSELVKITGSQSAAIQALNAIGVKAGAIATESAAAYKMQKVQIEALEAATVQLAGFTAGPAAAAQNAMTNLFMNEQLPAIQKITQAEDNLINVVVGGQLAFDTFGQGMGTLASNFQQVTGTSIGAAYSLHGLKGAASVAGAALDGTSQASDALNQAFYTQIQNGQKLNDALMQQGISTGDLTKVVATSAEQLIGYAGTNHAAKSAIVDLINNALGPGTVTLQSLDQWVGTNQVSMSNYRSIIDKSTESAGRLTGALSNQLNQMQANALFQATGGQTAWNTFTRDILNGTTQSHDFHTATQQVMTQLAIQSNYNLPKAQRAFEDYAIHGLGLTKQQADALWKTDLPGLQSEIDRLHGKILDIYMVGRGQYSIRQVFNAANPPNQSLPGGFPGGVGAATGAYITAGTTSTADDVLARVSKGELIVPTDIVASGEVDHLRGKIPGFATGGLAGSSNPYSGNLTPSYIAGMTANFQKTFTSAMITQMQAALHTAEAAAQAAISIPGGGHVSGGVARWLGTVDQALTMLHLPLALAGRVLYQMQTESGGNPYAINLWDINAKMGDPSRGLLQLIMTTFDAYHVPGTSWNIYDPLANTAAGINYAEHTYGPSLMNAAGQGMGSGHGYAAGGYMPPGTWGYVGERGKEIAKARQGGGVDIVPLHHDNEGLKVVQNYYGTQYPTAEQRAQMKVDLALALGVGP